jgi:ribosomal protein S18 acetylase RimI-like enzyme
MTLHLKHFEIRDEIVPQDRGKISRLLSNSGYFLPREMAYGMDLFDAHLLKGSQSHYSFLLFEQGTMLLAYGCYGKIRLSDRRYHLHWLAVDRDWHHKGVGRQIESAIVDRIRVLGGVKIFAEVSNRDYHTIARAFYESIGYRLSGSIPDYYGDKDDMLLYAKDLCFPADKPL